MLVVAVVILDSYYNFFYLSDGTRDRKDADEVVNSMKVKRVILVILAKRFLTCLVSSFIVLVIIR